MPIQREFLGLEQPALPAAVDYLLGKYRSDRAADLSEVLVVVPGGRASRRLLELLVERTSQEQLLLTPPQIVTVGKLPEEIYTPQRPFASDLTQELAWTRALRSTPPEALRPLLPSPPHEQEDDRWHELGRELCRQHVELAADDLNFRDVAVKGAKQEGFLETRRWEAMATVQEGYLRLLDSLELWDKQTARLVAIKHREFITNRDIVVIGTVDMNVATRHMLDQVAEHVTALIFAPESWSDRFDEHGCLCPDRWQDVTIPLAPEQVDVVHGPADQALAVLRQIAAYGQRYTADDITIGVPDEQLVPEISRVLDGRGLATRWGPGQPLLESTPCTLLSALADYLQKETFQTFAALVRHPDLDRWLARQKITSQRLQELDAYHAVHLPYRLRGRWLGPPADSQQLSKTFRAVQRLTQPFKHPARSLKLWNEPLLQFMTEVYEGVTFQIHAPIDRTTLAACEALRDALAGHAAIPALLSPELSCTVAIRWTLEQMSSERSPPPLDESAIEMLGWLELPLDDAPALIVTSLNEAFVPDSVNSDLFLPNALRTQLGLLDNPRRYARDAYALSVMLAARQEMRVIVGRRNQAGDPLVPSRLLFATDSEQIARRALAFFRPLADEATLLSTAARLVSQSEPIGLAIPRPQPLTEPIARMSVTSFRDYIACPYRYYLRHVLRLRTADDHSDELDGAAFGSLAHEVLRRFGACPERDSTDADQIRGILHECLRECVAETYGTDAMAVVHVQVEQLRLRLDAFAEVQAKWAASGWRIEHTEVPTSDHQAAILTVDGEPMTLAGRIDRIDFHAELGRRIVFDYKTSDTAKSPAEAHRRNDAWVDLQLPLYRHLVRSLGIDDPTIQFGYILLSKDASRVEYCLAEWTADELNDADERAREIIRAVRREQFWPPTDPAPDFSEDFAAICQDRVFGRPRGSHSPA